VISLAGKRRYYMAKKKKIKEYFYCRYRNEIIPVKGCWKCYHIDNKNDPKSDCIFLNSCKCHNMIKQEDWEKMIHDYRNSIKLQRVTLHLTTLLKNDISLEDIETVILLIKADKTIQKQN
jgi:hypothetical protein